jgi:hypothetical protein
MNRNLSLLAGQAAPAFSGYVPWVNPATQVTEWIPAPVIDDCIGGGPSTSGFGWSVSSVLNSGTITVGSSEAGHMGLYLMQTSTTTNGVANLRLAGNLFFGQAGKKHRLMMCFKTPAALSDGTNTYTLAIGFGDATTAGPTNAAMIEYSHAINSGNWLARTLKGGVSTSASGGSNVVVEAAKYYWVYIELDNTGAKFWIAKDSTSAPGVPGVFTYLGASAANFPDVSANRASLQCSIIKSLGTTSAQLTLDRVFLST